MKHVLAYILLGGACLFLLGNVIKLREINDNIRARLLLADSRVEAARQRCFLRWHTMRPGE